MIVTSDLISPIRALGSYVILTCTVELSPAVDVPVTLSMVWTGPDGATLPPTTLVMESLTRYTSTAIVSSFGRNQSGVYTCIATVSPKPSSLFLMKDGSEILGTVEVTTGIA